jgi:integrase
MNAIYKNELKAGKTSWSTYILAKQPDGSTRQIWKTFRRKSDAEAWRDSTRTEVREGTFRELRKSTFSQYVEHWLKTHTVDLKASTVACYKSSVRAHLIPAFGNRPLTAITPGDINRFRADLPGKAAKTVTMLLTLLGKILSDAVSDGYLKLSPMSGVKRPPKDRSTKGRALQPEEIARLLNTLDADFELQVRFALLTGLRQGEQFGLRWEDVDFRAGTIRVERSLSWLWGSDAGGAHYRMETPKTEAGNRLVDIGPGLLADLRELHLRQGRRKGLIWAADPEGRTPVVPQTIYRRHFKPALQAAGIEGRVRWHDLRHTFGSLKIAQGEDIVYVSRQLGHANVSMTVDTYSHQIRARRPEAAARTEELLFGTTG